ncbi:MAG: heavy-metal-associated domain-containing protein [Deltaproteobacteria bacterium]|nr:heavy-metal-associated domain-containing protein [Deltaproteobacteria bacterium]
MEERTVNIPAISCGHCIMTIRNEISSLQGVESVEGDESTKTVVFRWDQSARWETIADRLKEIGYPAT